MARMTCLGLLALVACGGSQSSGERAAGPSDSTSPELEAPLATEGVSETPADPQAQRAIFGGTLHIAEDGHTAIVGDVQGDRLFVVDTATGVMKHSIALEAGAIPFRITDAGGQAYVSLRGSGQIAVVDLASGELVDTWEACLEPRGLDVDGGNLWLACASSELVRIDRSTGARSVLQVDKDLRDVVVDEDFLWVSRLRSAEVLRITRDGEILERQSPPMVRHQRSVFGDADPFGSTVGWSMSKHPLTGVVVTHQRAFLRPLVIVPGEQEGAYGVPEEPLCGGILATGLTWFTSEAPPVTSRFVHAPLAVDSEVQANGSVLLAVAGADNASDVVRVSASAFDGGETGACSFEPAADVFATSRATSVRVDHAGRTVVLGRAPLTLRIDGALVDLGVAPDLPDAGFSTFHADAGLGVSCAGCHPEANDDGHTWNFDPIGPRRTQSVAVGLAGTEPFHWDGDMDDMTHLMSDVFVGRMGGDEDSATEATSSELLTWLDAQVPHRVTPSGTLEQISRGGDLFWSAEVGCGDCHTGTSLTDSKTHRVGTGRPLQTPSLVGIAGRGPYMHDGCAKTLHERFGECGGGDRHGVTSHLDAADIDALVAYLETL